MEIPINVNVQTSRVKANHLFSTHNSGHDHGEVGPDVAAELGRGRVDQLVDEVLGVCERWLVLRQHTSVDVHDHNLVFPQQFLKVERKHYHHYVMCGRNGNAAIMKHKMDN